MKFLDLQLEAFGPFTDQCLAFSPAGPDLHIVYGANEAGKTSCMRAIDNLLYGVPVNTTDNFLHENPKLRIGARLLHSTGKELEVHRRKGRTNTLLDAAGSPVDTEDFSRFLGHLSHEIYRALFSLTRAEVERGNREILAAEGHLGEALFSAGLGGAGVGTAIEQLTAEADALYRPRGSKQVLNRARNEVESLRARIAEVGLTPQRWEELKGAVAGGEARLELLDAELARLRSDERACERDCKAFDAARSRKSALQRLEDEDITEALTAQSGAMDELRRGFSDYLKRRDAVSELEAESKRLRVEWDEQTRRLFPDRELEPDAPIPVGREGELKIDELATRYEDATLAVAAATTSIESEKARLNQLSDELANQTAREDITPLLSALSAANDAGDLDGEITKTAQQLDTLENRLETGLQSLGLWTGSANALAALPAPPTSTVERFELAFAKAKEEVTQEERETRRISDEITRRSGDEGKSKSIREVPTPSELDVARARRDELLSTILKATESNAEPPDAAHVSDLTESIRETDQIADSLLEHAHTVEKRVRDEREIKNLREQLENAKERRSNARAALARIEEEWFAEWAPAGIQPRPPREMHDWLRQRTQLLQYATDLTDVSNAQSELKRNRRRLGAQLAAALGESAPEDGTLAELKVLAKTLADAHAKSEGARRQLAEQRVRTEESLNHAERRAAEAESSLNTVVAEWEEALPRLGFSPDASPESGRKLARDLSGLWALQRDLRSAESNLENARKTVAQFERGIANVRDAAGYAEEMGHLSHAECFEQIEARLERSRELHHEIATADARLRDSAPDGVAPDAFALSLLERGEQTLEAALGEARRKLALAEDEREAAFSEFTLRRREFEDLDGSAEAAQLEEERQSLLAKMRTDAEQWAILTLARKIIQHGVERYRKENQGPVLTRACEIFSALTAGAFERIAAEIDASDEPVLAAIRDSGESVLVDHLSEGTRDQLYLALRLAGLERYIAKHEPLPLLVDDILITFDDERSTIVLKLLAQLSKQTQVLLFTHHRHVVELAKKATEFQLHTL